MPIKFEIWGTVKSVGRKIPGGGGEKLKKGAWKKTQKAPHLKNEDCEIAPKVSL